MWCLSFLLCRFCINKEPEAEPSLVSVSKISHQLTAAQHTRTHSINKIAGTARTIFPRIFFFCLTTKPWTKSFLHMTYLNVYSFINVNNSSYQNKMNWLQIQSQSFCCIWIFYKKYLNFQSFLSCNILGTGWDKLRGHVQPMYNFLLNQLKIL